ncbi:MAG: DUF2000 domain-containing protein [Parachlamydiaceae bacterium]|nr:DUF2000 domain-containing protein [Parachlamydiaceae bacterium]
MSENKCVVILNENLPLGQLVNSAAVLMMSMGKLHPDLVGHNLEDGSGHLHLGITTVPLPVLKGAGKLKEIREKIKLHEGELTVVDLIDATSTTASYEEYAAQLKMSALDVLNYHGMAIFGNRKLVNKYTGSLGLLR